MDKFYIILEIAVVGCLLQSTPALKIVDFSLPEEYAKTQYIKFLERISELGSFHADKDTQRVVP